MCKTIADDKISLKYFLINKIIANELTKLLNAKKFAIFFKYNKYALLNEALKRNSDLKK